MLDAVTRLLDPTAFLLVTCGSLLCAVFRSTRSDLWGAVRALRPMLKAAPDKDDLRARRAVGQIERLCEVKGIACADHVNSQCPVIRQAAFRLADTASVAEFKAWASNELECREARHRAVAAVWRAAADASPNMGMIGTVLGLVGMFASMDDPARMGPAMALAMLTTLYGLLLGSLLFGPISARLERLSAAELAWQKVALARLAKIADAQSVGSWLVTRQRTG